MSMQTHLGGIALGTAKDGAGANMGAVIVSQTKAHVFGADATVTTVCVVPAGAQILNIHFDTTTAYNAATTNTIKFGTASGGAELVAATSVASLGRASFLTTGVYSAWMTSTTADTTIYATFNQTGTVASTGAGRITVVYAVKNSDASIANLP